LVDGDILNIDVTLYHGGFHGDLNETYYVGDRARADPESVRVVEAARECLDEAIKLVKPGALFRDYGNVIEKHAKSKNCSVIRTYCGHGINSLFHCAPNVPHYAKNKAVGAAKEGMTFTIEPMIALGSYRDVTWRDDWTSTTSDGKRTAQFGEYGGNYFSIYLLIPSRAYTSCHSRWSGSAYCEIAGLPWRSCTCAVCKWRRSYKRREEG
jgi:methionyl aminopeptidase